MREKRRGLAEDPLNPLFQKTEGLPQTRKQAIRERGKVTRKQVNKQRRKEGTLPARKEAPQKAQTVPFQPDEVKPMDRVLYRKQTYELTREDLDFLDTAKYEIRKEHHARVTKNEIVKTALELLRKDYRANKETSFLVRKFVGK